MRHLLYLCIYEAQFCIYEAHLYLIGTIIPACVWTHSDRRSRRCIYVCVCVCTRHCAYVCACVCNSLAMTMRVSWKCVDQHPARILIEQFRYKLLSDRTFIVQTTLESKWVCLIKIKQRGGGLGGGCLLNFKNDQSTKKTKTWSSKICIYIYQGGNASTPMMIYDRKKQINFMLHPKNSSEESCRKIFNLIRSKGQVGLYVCWWVST